MDQKRTDAEGGRVVYRNKRVRKLAVVVAVQNVVVAVCLMVTLYMYWCFWNPPMNNVHVQFNPTEIALNSTMKFPAVVSSNMMDVTDEDKIYIKCTGPYIWYMDVCYKSLMGKETSGTLQLLVGSKTPVSSVELQATHEVCRGHYRIAYLRAKDLASMRLESTAGFRIKNVTVGLSYLLGKNCEY